MTVKALSNAQEAKGARFPFDWRRQMNDHTGIWDFDNLIPVPAVEELLSRPSSHYCLRCWLIIAARRG